MRNVRKNALDLTRQPLTEPLPERPVPSSGEIEEMIARVRRRLRYSCPPDVAEEIALDAVVKTYERWRESTQKWDSLTGYAIVVAERLLMDNYRKHNRSISLDSDLLNEESLSIFIHGEQENPTEAMVLQGFDEVLRRRLNAAIQDAVQTLKPEEQATLRLWMEGRKQTEIADVLGRSQAAVSYQLRRILMRIRQRLEERFSPEEFEDFNALRDSPE